MPQKKIDVVFHIPHYDDNIGTSVRITRITPAALFPQFYLNEKQK